MSTHNGRVRYAHHWQRRVLPKIITQIDHTRYTQYCMSTVQTLTLPQK